MTTEIRSLCTIGEFTIGQNANIAEAIEVMQRNKKGAVVIEDDKKLRAILSERDVVRLLADSVDLNQKAILHATQNPITVNESRSIIHTLIIMTENEIRRIVVVDDHGNFMGLVTHKDLVTHIEDDAYRSNLKVKHIHERVKRVIYAKPNENLKNILKLMSENRISAIPIFENNKAVGIISEKDILDIASRGVSLDALAKEVMHSPIISVKIDTLVVDAVKLMNDKNIRRVLVKDNDDNCVGIITQKDILRNFESDYKTLISRKFKHTKDVLNMLPEMVVEVLDGKDEQVVVWANKKSVEFFGDAIVDKKVDNLLKNDWLAIYMRIIKDGAIERYKVTQNEHIFEISGFYMRSESPDERGRIKLIIRDITSSEIMQANVKGELETYLRIINSTDDIILLYGAYDGKIKIANESTLKSLGIVKGEIYKKTIFDIVAEEKELIEEKIAQIIKEDKIVKGVRHYKRSNGEVFPVEITATKVVLENSIYVLIVARDISEKLALEKMITKRNEELSLFHNFINSLNRSSGIDEAYEVLTFYLLQSGVDSVHIYNINPSLTRISETSVKQNKPLWQEDCLSSDLTHCKVMLSGTQFAKNSSKEFGCPLAKLDKSAKSYLCQSVYSSGKLIAIISLVSTKEQFFDQEITRFLSDLFNAFSLLVSNLRLIEINRELSIRDPLTNLYNRRFLNEYLAKEADRTKRSGAPLSVIMIDLDDFKRLNDRYGHEVGDVALKIVASTIDKQVRKGDIAARYGGEEFLVALPNCTKEDGIKMAERIRVALENAPISSDKGGKLYITASIGIATLDECANAEVQELIILADDRMYQAKNGGKNSIVF